MSTTSIPEPSRFSAWLAHQSLPITAVTAALVIASNTIDNSWLASASVIAMAAWIASGAYRIQHDRRLCEQCMSAMPLDGPQRAQHRAGRLRACHAMQSRTATLCRFAMLAGGILAAKPWSMVLMDVLFVAAAVDEFLLATHRPLQPWCPQCHWGDGGGGDDEHVDDPVPTGEGTKVST